MVLSSSLNSFVFCNLLWSFNSLGLFSAEDNPLNDYPDEISEEEVEGEDEEDEEEEEEGEGEGKEE